MLDLGTGNGYAARALSDAVEAGRVVGVDAAPEMARNADAYRSMFRTAGFHVAAQSQVPDTDTEIPPTEVFPTGEFEARAEMVERYRELRTLLTVGVVP